MNARLQYCIEASKNLPSGVSSKRHTFSTLIKPPNTHVSRKREGDRQCGAPPAKSARKYLMSPQDFVNCVTPFLAATFSKSAEKSINSSYLAFKLRSPGLRIIRPA